MILHVPPLGVDRDGGGGLRLTRGLLLLAVAAAQERRKVANL